LLRTVHPADTGRVDGSAALWLVVALLLPTGCGVVWVVGRRSVRRLAERRRTPVAGPPIERVSDDLRRLHALLAETENAPNLPGKHVRCQATRAAYLDALATACRQLDVPPPAGRPVSRAEIYRVEADLRRVGLDVRAIR
jgi:hypothetical protein